MQLDPKPPSSLDPGAPRRWRLAARDIVLAIGLTVIAIVALAANLLTD